MTNKEFIYQRIRIYSDKDFDPMEDSQVESILRAKFNIYLPQRRSVNESLEATKSDHEIIALILQYRTAEQAV